MKNYISWRTIFFQRQWALYINFNSIHRVQWLGFDLKVFSSIYVVYQPHSIFYL